MSEPAKIDTRKVPNDMVIAETHNNADRKRRPSNAGWQHPGGIMGRERSYEDIVGKGQEKRYLAYARSEEEKVEILEWFEGLRESPEPIGPVITKAGPAVRKLFERLYRDRVFPYEQYNVLFMANVEKLSREQIRGITGKSAGALRKIIYDAKQTLKRKGLWDKYGSVCDF